MLVDSAFGIGRHRFQFNLFLIRQYRINHFLQTIPVLFIVIGCSLLLNTISFFHKNPIKLLYSWVIGGSSNGGGNFMFTGIGWTPYALVLLTLLLVAIPSLAYHEELSFRKGTIGWVSGIKRSVVFGMAHMVMLISFGTAIALSIGGAWFTYQYFKGGVMRSTIYHSVYNSTLVLFLLTAVVLS